MPALMDRRRRWIVVALLGALCLLRGSAALGDACEDKCAEKERSCLATIEESARWHQYTDPAVCKRAREACHFMCNQPVLGRDSARENGEARRAAEAKRQELLGLFKSAMPATPPSPQTAQARNACLEGNPDACRQIHPASRQDALEADLACRTTLGQEMMACGGRYNRCRAECESRRIACERATCDPICSAHPSSLKCMLCTCPQEIACDCQPCSHVNPCPRLNEGNTRVR